MLDKLRNFMFDTGMPSPLLDALNGDWNRVGQGLSKNADTVGKAVGAAYGGGSGAPKMLTSSISNAGMAELGALPDAASDEMGGSAGGDPKIKALMKALNAMGKGLEGLNNQRNKERELSVMDAQRFGGMNLGGVAPVMGPVQPLPIPDFTPIQSPSQLKRFF